MATNALAISALSMQADVKRIELIGQNLANITTPGYRRVFTATHSFPDIFNGNVSPERFPYGGIAAEKKIDNRVGPIKSTGKILDLAIDGNLGFFELAGANGPVYTRRGDFSLDARGRIVSADGFALMGDSGEIFLPKGKLDIDANGVVKVDSVKVAKIRIAVIEDANSLTELGNGLYSGLVSQSNKEVVGVVPGHLEGSSVVSMTEMVNMLETMRHFEANQKLMQGYDEVLSKAIQKLGEF
ncbi:flagellar hook-basal body protein [Parachitinimonas caeni]|uniref:Flagellar hook basal-body protein n=1 Tax=Parachitinimonas caeni TaxID=3031301 RepID=A0ABT7DYG9_9NEIS|nr:flagellar hook basal-body protein [Parachitinimonas caeni]MDK2125115.1 flagellar hook basal-body protein [Parachitinimonas caeni]